MRVDDRMDRPVHQPDPVGDLPHVGNGGRQGDQRHVLRRVDDDLLPDGASALVPHVVALVEHHVAEALQGPRVEHVPQDLGGHHQHGRARVDLDVPGQDADLRDAELPAEVGVLLVGQRLERRRVGHAALRGERVVDRELRDEGLPRPRRRGHDHRGAFQDGEDRRDLEIVEGVRVPPGERPEQIDGVLGDTTGVEGRLDRRGGLVGQRVRAPLPWRIVH